MTNQQKTTIDNFDHFVIHALITELTEMIAKLTYRLARRELMETEEVDKVINNISGIHAAITAALGTEKSIIDEDKSMIDFLNDLSIEQIEIMRKSDGFIEA